MVTEEMMEEIRRLFCKDACVMHEAGLTYIHFSTLKLPEGSVPPFMEALLCLQNRDGYTTRLFFEAVVQGKGQNWTVHNIFGKGWHTCSWNNVVYNNRPVEVLIQHLRAFT